MLQPTLSPIPLLALLAALPALAADCYHFDGTRSRVSLGVQRFGTLWVGAEFRQFSGSFVLDPHGKDSRLDVVVETQSLHAGDPHWNTLLRAPEWFDIERFPQLVYHSQHVEFEGSDRARASGELTLRGVTRPVVLEIAELGCATAAARSCNFVATTQVLRSEFGLPHGFWLAGDRVTVSVSGVAELVPLRPPEGVSGPPVPRSER